MTKGKYCHYLLFLRIGMIDKGRFIDLKLSIQDYGCLFNVNLT